MHSVDVRDTLAILRLGPGIPFQGTMILLLASRLWVLLFFFLFKGVTISENVFLGPLPEDDRC